MTGHLEQAGEASDFAEVRAAENAPKGMFPTWVPGAGGPLGVQPFSSSTVRLPAEAASVQIEPEVGLLVDLSWRDEELQAVRATGFAAYNDVSIRRAAPKISHKKNWGPDSKGLSERIIGLPHGLGRGCALDRYRLVSFLVREGEAHDYGEDSPVLGYSYYHARLMDWVLHRLQTQTDVGPLEDLGAWLTLAGRPTRAMIGIGATRYTAFGAVTMLEPGDDAVVVVYDGTVHSPADVRARVAAGEDDLVEGSVLRQRVLAG